MATARETLYEEMVELTGQPPGDDAADKVKQIMLRYRVQTKPGVTTQEGRTARDDLGDRLLQLWRDNPDDKNDRIGTEIDKFRMQAKGKSGGSKKAIAPKKAPAGGNHPSAPAARSEPPAPAGDAGSPAADAGEPAPRPARRPSGRPGLEPVAGGPRRRGKTRSECPKCHSMGVVLARSYAGDEYYSCIYCGWQAFKPADENDPTASLAGRLLGQTPKG